MARLLNGTWEICPQFVGHISTYVGYLYEQFSVKPLPDTIMIPNDTWRPFIKTLYKGNKQDEPTYIINKDLIPEVYGDTKSDEDQAILAFSGGKDSTANLLYMLDEGKKVTCVFTKGVNRSATQEAEHAEYIANMYNTPIIFDQIAIGGKTDYFENPVKNIFIISRLLEYGIKNGCTVVSIGETHNLVSDEMDIMYNYSDSVDFIKQFETAIQTHVPTFKVDWIFKEESTDFSYVIHNHPEVIPHLHSCLMPTRYKKMQLKYTEKYHLHADITRPNEEGIMQDRCMNCWKCMAEWVYLVCWNKLPYNKQYMIEKVIPTITKKIGQLDKTLEGKTDLKVSDLLEALVEINTLKQYVKDPNKIYRDSYHYHTELNRRNINVTNNNN